MANQFDRMTIILTKWHLLDKIIFYKSDHTEGTPDSKVIRLKGNAEVKGEDIKIQSGEITLYLSEWRLL